jgi:hypothetical protein
MSPSSPPAGFAHQNLEQRLIANAFSISDRAGSRNIGFGQAKSDLCGALLVQLCNQVGSSCLGPLALASADRAFT